MWRKFMGLIRLWLRHAMRCGAQRLRSVTMSCQAVQNESRRQEDTSRVAVGSAETQVYTVKVWSYSF